LAEIDHGIYEVLTFGKHYYRSIGAEPVDIADAVKTTINETIDASVFDRWQKDASYRPKNLIEWASRKGVDPTALLQSVHAKDGTALPSAGKTPNDGAAHFQTVVR
jgi:hypothetical protein